VGESKGPILNIGHTRWVCVRVLNIRVVNAALGNLEVKVNQYLRPTVDVRCICSDSVYVLGSERFEVLSKNFGYFFVSYYATSSQYLCIARGMDSMPIRAPSSKEMCYDTTRQQNNLKICNLSDLQIEYCHNLANLVMYTYCGIETVKKGNRRRLKEAA